MGLGLAVEAGDEGIDGGVGFHLGGVDEEFPAPDQPSLLAQLDYLLEEALEHLDAQALAGPRQAGVVRQILVQGVTQVPAVGEVQAGGLDQPALGAQALEEHAELQLEEDHRVDARRPRSA